MNLAGCFLQVKIMDNNQVYKLIIQGTLVQTSAFSIGGNTVDTQNVDMPLAKDGKGRFTIRGQGLAGAFIATANTLYEDLPPNISEKSPQQQPKKTPDSLRMKESVWLFHHAHLINKQQSDVTAEIRDNVCIRQKTGAAKDGAKFDAETLPAGTKWQFLMEVDEYRDKENHQLASSIALNVVKQWQQCCWLGRDVARGLGWMKLIDVEIIRLDTGRVNDWPDSGKDPHKHIEKFNADELTLEDELAKPVATESKNIYSLTGSINITVGEQEEDSYGLDFLSVGGNNNDEDRNRQIPGKLSGKKALSLNRDKLIKPQGQTEIKYLDFNGKDIDFNIALTQDLTGKPQPFIPGSSLRGPLRHTLSWLHRRNNEEIWEPAGENDYPEDKDIVLQLFGSTQQSAQLLISDAMPVNNKVNNNWQMLVLEMHAEDEFTQGVYGSSKFDRTCLTRGEFKADFYLTAKDDEELEKFKAELQKLNTLGEQQMIAIGGGQWKGLGWVKLLITFDKNSSKTESHPLQEEMS